MSTNKNDYEHMLFYFAYKTFITTADEIIEKYGMSRQHHRFLFFINKLPGITIKSLLEILEISKQGSHATLQKLKEQGLIIEKVLETDELNKAQDELLQNIYQQVGSDWYDVMEALAKGRPGFDFIKHLKDEKES